MTDLSFYEWGTGLLLAAVFFVSFAESLAVVGLLVPGVAVLLGLTLAAAASGIPLWAWLVCGVVGAFCGDGLSYVLGQRAGPAVHRWRFFRHHPLWLERGEVFFQRWGAWSIIIGRFIGPVRPVVPLVAGAFNMPASRFWLANAVSAPAWGVAYLASMYWLGEEFADAFDLKTVLMLMTAATLIAVMVSFLFKGRRR